MIAATVLAVFFAPVFYVVMQRLSEWRTKKEPAPHATPKVPPKVSLPPEPVHAHP
jgi:HAE1 family hydrophobic/amphiphilic exporter-1